MGGVPETCSNLEPRAARRRGLAGVVVLVGLLVAAWFVIDAGLARPWRLALLPGFFFAALCLVQARRRV